MLCWICYSGFWLFVLFCFAFRIWNISHHSLLSCKVSSGKTAVVWLLFPCKLLTFLKRIFKYAFFVFNQQELDYYVPWQESLQVVSIWGSQPFLYLTSPLFLHVGEVLIYYFVEYIFQSSFSFHMFRNFYDTYVWSLMVSLNIWVVFLALLNSPSIFLIVYFLTRYLLALKFYLFSHSLYK